MSYTYKDALNEYVNQKEFSYDHEQDPAYQAVAKQYMREGRRASADAMAQAAAMSGGRVSSAALTTAQQVGNQYAAALSDMIPTLRENARAEYLADRDAKYDIMTALKAQEETEYQRQLDEENRKRLAVQDALTKYQALGYATDDVAKTLGISAGRQEFVYRPLNQSGTTGGKQWIMVGNTKLTQDEIDNAITAGKIDATYDNKTGTVNYEWVEGQEPAEITPPGGEAPSTTPPRYKITNRRSQDEGWVMVNGTKLTYVQLDKYIRAGKVEAVVDESREEITYKPTSKWQYNRMKVAGDNRPLLT